MRKIFKYLCIFSTFLVIAFAIGTALISRNITQLLNEKNDKRIAFTFDRVKSYEFLFSSAKYTLNMFKVGVELHNVVENITINSVRTKIKYDLPLNLYYDFLNREVVLSYLGSALIQKDSDDKTFVVVGSHKIKSIIPLGKIIKCFYDKDLILQNALNLDLIESTHDVQHITYKDDKNEVLYPGAKSRITLNLYNKKKYESLDDFIKNMPKGYKIGLSFSSIEDTEVSKNEIPVSPIIGLYLGLNKVNFNVDLKFSTQSDALDVNNGSYVANLVIDDKKYKSEVDITLYNHLNNNITNKDLNFSLKLSNPNMIDEIKDQLVKENSVLKAINNTTLESPKIKNQESVVETFIETLNFIKANHPNLLDEISFKATGNLKNEENLYTVEIGNLELFLNNDVGLHMKSLMNLNFMNFFANAKGELSLFKINPVVDIISSQISNYFIPNVSDSRRIMYEHILNVLKNFSQFPNANNDVFLYEYQFSSSSMKENTIGSRNVVNVFNEAKDMFFKKIFTEATKWDNVEEKIIAIFPKMDENKLKLLEILKDSLKNNTQKSN